MKLSHPRLIRLIVMAMAFALALPLLIGVRSLTPEEVQRQFNRPPTVLPGVAEVARDPARAVQQTVAHLSERVAGVAPVTRWLQQVRFEWLGDPTSPLIARRGDLVFLAAFDVNAPVMSNLDASCRVGEGRAPPDWLVRLGKNTQDVAEVLRSQGARVGFLIVPSKPVLYYDQLPRGTPLSIRARCQRAARSGELESWAAQMGQAGIAASYPLAAFMARRDDPTYYPMGNFHAEGASAQDAVAGLLPQMYPDRTAWPVFTPEVAALPGDLEFILTFPRPVARQVPDYGPHAAPLDYAQTDTLRASDPAFRSATVYASADPVIGGTALIIGNSFGKHTAPNVAPYFGRTIQFDMAGATDAELAVMFRDLAPQADAILFIVQDTAAKYWLWQRERDVLAAR